MNVLPRANRTSGMIDSARINIGFVDENQHRKTN